MSATARELIDAVSEIDPAFGRALGGAIKVLDFAAVAHEEIDQAVRMWPLWTDRLAAAYDWLQPLGLIRDEYPPDPLYRAHCGEILRRIVDDEDLVPGTDAEIVAVLSAASKMAPLKSEFGWLYWSTLRRACPQIVDALEAQIGREPFHAGDWERREADAERARLRRQIGKVSPRAAIAAAARRARRRKG